MLYRKKLRAIREEKGITQDEVAQVVGVHRSYIVRFENGERSPNLPQFMNWCKALDVKAQDVLESMEEYL